MIIGLLIGVGIPVLEMFVGKRDLFSESPFPLIWSPLRLRACGLWSSVQHHRGLRLFLSHL